MCNNARPDFNVEEVASVKKNKRELITVLEDMADHLPKEDTSKGNSWNSAKSIKIHQITKFQQWMVWPAMTLTGEIGSSGESGENAQNLVFLGAASVRDSDEAYTVNYVWDTWRSVQVQIEIMWFVKKLKKEDTELIVNLLMTED